MPTIGRPIYYLVALYSSMTLLWLRLAVLLYGIAALAVLPAALLRPPPLAHARRPRHCRRRRSSTSSRSPKPSTPPTIACPSRPTKSSPACADPRARLPRRLRPLPQRLHRNLRPSHRLHAGHARRLPSRRRNLLRPRPHRLDLPPHRPAARRLRRADLSRLLASLLYLIQERRLKSKAGQSPLASAARHPARDHRPDRPQDPPLRPALHDRRPAHRLRHRPGGLRRAATSATPRSCSPSASGSPTSP